jgi:PAS domain S-box-containing protein
MKTKFPRLGRLTHRSKIHQVDFGNENDHRFGPALTEITNDGEAPQAALHIKAISGRRVEGQSSQLRLQAEAFAHIADGVVVTDGATWTESNIRFVNDAMCHITGYRRDELIRQPYSILQGRRTENRTLKRIVRELSGSNSCRAELIQYRKDGLPFVDELSITRVAQGTGRPSMFVSIHRDISERKQKERELDRYRKDLMAMASELMRSQERDQRRLAEELHRSLGHALFFARMKLDELSTAEPLAVEAGKALEEVARVLNRMTFELNPPVLRTLGLRPAVRSLSRSMEQEYSLSIEVSDDGEDIPLDDGVAMVLFRSVRELLTNVAKHAQTGRAKVSLRRVNQSLQVQVEDQGRGFNPADSFHPDSGHFGLFTIGERLRGLKGILKVRSVAGKGTTVTLIAPLAVEDPLVS